MARHCRHCLGRDLGPGRIALQALFWAGWLIVLGSTFMIDHFDLFGLRQVYLAWRQRAYSHVPFRTTMFYRFVRHPIMAGFIIAFWAAPTMTVGHLLFAAATTGYILVGVRVEAARPRCALGNSYRDYQRRVPRLIPGTTVGHRAAGETVVRGTTPGTPERGRLSPSCRPPYPRRRRRTAQPRTPPGTSTLPMVFIRFLPSFCFSSSLRLRVMSPP